MSANGFIRSFAGIWIVWFLSGFFLFPDAPIKECKQPSPSTYCGKGGVPYSEAAYARFEIWENGLIVGVVVLIPLGLWQRRLAARGDEGAIADRKRSNALGFRTLWAVRWLTGSLFGAQILFGLIGIFVFSEAVPFQRFWLGGALASFPGYVFGVVLQYRVAPAQMAEHKFTVWLTGLITLLLFAQGIQLAYEGMHAG